MGFFKAAISLLFASGWVGGGGFGGGVGERQQQSPYKLKPNSHECLDTPLQSVAF